MVCPTENTLHIPLSVVIKFPSQMEINTPQNSNEEDRKCECQ